MSEVAREYAVLFSLLPDWRERGRVYRCIKSAFAI